MSERTYKTSRAVICPADNTMRTVYALDAQNPETVLAHELRAFTEQMGYSEIFPNFDRLRIGVVHPFAIILAQEVLEQPKTTGIFPSITIADSNASEDSPVLSNDIVSFMYTAQEVAVLDGYRQAKEIFISDHGWARILDTVKTKGSIAGTKRSYRTRNTVNLNIWSENKDVTSFLYDTVGHFLTQRRQAIHSQYAIDIGAISGGRTGDINLDFGMLLYGANIQVGITMLHEAVLFDTAVEAASEIIIAPEHYSA